MRRTLAVGVETSCKAPARVELLKTKLARVFGAGSLFFPDHWMTNAPRRGRGAGPEASRWSPGDAAFLDPFVMLGALAARRPRARLGIGVTDPIRRHPALLAQAGVTLDHLSNGRAILGLGAGSRENVTPWGLPFDRRAERLGEAIAIVRLLWRSRGDPVDLDGDFWRLRGAVFATPLVGGGEPRLWVAAHAPRTLALAGRVGDGWYPTVKPAPNEYRSGLEAIAGAAREAGRPLASFEPALQAFVILGPGRRRVLDETLRHPAAASLLLSQPAASWRRAGLEHPLGERRGFSDFLSEEATERHLEEARRNGTPELLASGVFAGGVADVVGEVRPLVAAGLRHLVIANVGPGFRGARADDLLRFAIVIRRLRRLPLPDRATSERGTPSVP